MDLLVNIARSYIFTAAAAAAIDVIDSDEGDKLRNRPRASIDRIRPGHPSPIIPIIVGAAGEALAASDALARQGILVPAIRPPTVPAGTCRLRVTVSAVHTDADLDRLIEALRQAGAKQESMSERSVVHQDRRQSRWVVIFVTGTGTEVGKTWVSAELARLLRHRGHTVAACKPLQSYDPDHNSPTDAAVLAAATRQHPDAVCPPERTYPVLLAPPMAARKLGRVCPTLDELADHCRFAATTDVGLVEGVGGLYSPMASDGHNLDLIERTKPDLVVVVASAAIGGIHDAMACTLPLSAHRQAIFLNRYDPRAEVHLLNVRWLRDTGLAVATTVPELADTVCAVAGSVGHSEATDTGPQPGI